MVVVVAEEDWGLLTLLVRDRRPLQSCADFGVVEETFAGGFGK